MFSGIAVLFAGLPAVRVKIFSNIISSNGGSVIKSEKKTAFKSSRNKLNSNVDYIIVEKRLSIQNLCAKIHCDHIPSSVGVVKCTWLEQCAAQKTLLNTDMFDAIIPVTEEVEKDCAGMEETQPPALEEAETSVCTADDSVTTSDLSLRHQHSSTLATSASSRVAGMHRECILCHNHDAQMLSCV